MSSVKAEHVCMSKVNELAEAVGIRPAARMIGSTPQAVAYVRKHGTGLRHLEPIAAEALTYIGTHACQCCGNMSAQAMEGLYRRMEMLRKAMDHG